MMTPVPAPRPKMPPFWLTRFVSIATTEGSTLRSTARMSIVGATPFGAAGAALPAVDGAADPEPDEPEFEEPPCDGAALVTGAAADVEELLPSRATATPPTTSAAIAAPATPPNRAARLVLRPFGAGTCWLGGGGGSGSEGPPDPISTVGC